MALIYIRLGDTIHCLLLQVIDLFLYTGRPSFSLGNLRSHLAKVIEIRL